MLTSELLATVIVLIVIASGVVVFCCLWWLWYKNTTPGNTTYHERRVTPSSLESGLFELTNRPSKGVKFPTHEIFTLVKCDGPEDSPDQERPVTQLPHQFHDFVVQKIIPSFNSQRLVSYQFAVVLLLSESDFKNINQTSFIPSNFLGQPILNKTFPSMPLANYGNYIVARPNSYHSEEEIFGQYSVIGSPFSRLWSAYVGRNGAYPKCILIYSWNLPCSRCTDVIIRSLGEQPYNCTNVIVAHTICWRSETDLDYKNNREKLMNKNITVEQVPYPIQLQPA